MRHARFWLIVVAISAVSADDEVPPLEWVRRGNEAFELRDYRGAVACYTQAQGRIEDPGLVAFNHATSLYHQSRFQEAEQEYRRCLDDRAAPRERQARALFNLGNCLLRQAEESTEDDLDRLRAAVSCYRRSLDAQPGDVDFRADIIHNLELAKLRWAAAAARAINPPPPSHEPSDSASLPDPATQPGQDQRNIMGDPREGGNSGNRDTQRAKTAPGSQQAQPTEQQTPGAGDLPVLHDETELTPLTQQEALQHLQQTAQRLRRERRQLSEGNSGGDRPDVRNW